MGTFDIITPADAATLIAQEPVGIIDIRDAAAFAAGHIDSAYNLDNSNLQQFIDSAEVEQPLIVYCYHGHSSQPAAAYFAERGFTKVYSMTGGYEAWKLIC
ncbi:MAG: thiosulfate sulfurtransferase [Halieaceae bacterium]|jgi:thiosulfate sulfurtransferase